MSLKLFRTVVPTVFSLLASASLFAQDDSEPMVIVVTPSGIEQSVNDANTTLTVIDQKTIEESNARSVAELLRGQAGVHVTDFFGDGSQATIDLRGFGPTASSNTLILIDGRKLNNSSDTGRTRPVSDRHRRYRTDRNPAGQQRCAVWQPGGGWRGQYHSQKVV